MFIAQLCLQTFVAYVLTASLCVCKLLTDIRTRKQARFLPVRRQIVLLYGPPYTSRFSSFFPLKEHLPVSVASAGEQAATLHTAESVV